MDARIAELIEYLSQGSYVTADNLSAQLGVSKRTVRTYIVRANDELAAIAHIDSDRRRGYRLVVADAQRFAEMASAAHSPEIPSTASGRVRYLMIDLLNRSDWVTLDSLAQILCVSRTTVSDALQEVDRRFAAYGIELQRKPYHGLRARGSERSIRLCLAALALEKSGFGAVSAEMVDAVAACVQEAPAKTGLRVSAVAFQNLIVHIAVAISRIRNGCYVPMESAQLVALRDSEAFATASAIAQSINARFHVDLPEEEIAYIAIHLAGRQVILPPENGADDEPENLVISDEVWNVVGEMLACVWEVFRFDFRHDLELRMNLARHLVPLAVRLRYRMRMDNPLLPDIKNRFPLAFSMAREVAGVLAEHYGNMPSDEEIGYIALAFALALDRQQNGIPKKNILIVCASGAGSARLLEHEYREEFGAYLDRIETCDALSIDEVDLRHIDYVFTTVPLSHALPVPTYEVTYFLDAQGASDVRDVLSAPMGISEGLRYFDRRLFFPALHAATKREALDALIDRFVESESVDADFRDLVWQREAAAPTCFGNRVAMPHPIRAVGERTVVAVAVLEEFVEWGEGEVGVIVLVSIARDRSEDLGAFYNILGHLLGSEKAISALIANPSFDVLAQEIQQLHD